jgi:valyl-tRNA synthetase
MSYTHTQRDLPKKYSTKDTETKWQKHWHTQQTYAWDAQSERSASYVIDTPPPTVSGHLHMGHVFSYTQADFIARYQRMKGKNVFYPMGFDDNGLPTERLVEKTKKIRAADMAREAFIDICHGVSEEARTEFRTLFESIALSIDWDQEYHTISEDVLRISQRSFLDLMHKDQAYRATRPFYWDPVDQTAIAQAEIVDKEMPSFQNIILFEVEGKKLPVMTTRPELLPACVALMYHPDEADKYAGKTATTPLFNIKVPMVADEKVEKEKGTGLVMCCTFGDDTDKEWWEKHKLETRVIVNKYGKIALPEGLVPADLAAQINGKKVSNPDKKHPGARQIIIRLLEESGLLTEQKPITHAVKCAERSGAPLEILPSEQWFIKVTDKKAALSARANEVIWHPDWMKTRIMQWIEGLNQDWCISRQRYFGVPFPVWYSKRAGEEGKMILADRDQLPVNPLTDVPRGYSAEEVTPDPDVMDTWATSSLSPQLSAGGIDASDKRFRQLFPADLRPQAHEIIRSWAFYTIVKSHLHHDTIPWKNIMISGWCLAEDKTKMSKSKGNVVTPIALIEEAGTDAVRYWAATARLGHDTAFSPEQLKIGKKLVTKLFNATKFAAIHLEKLRTKPEGCGNDVAITELMDQWILARLGQTIAAATEAFERYEYAVALDATNQFFWADFCDNYLELIKKRIYNEEQDFTTTEQQSAVHALYYCLEAILKLYAPIIPHVTEELYAHIFTDNYHASGSIHLHHQWPIWESGTEDTHALKLGSFAIEALAYIRAEKSAHNHSIKYPVSSFNLPENAPMPERWMADVAAAGNVQQWNVHGDHFSLIFADNADAA